MKNPRTEQIIKPTKLIIRDVRDSSKDYYLPAEQVKKLYDAREVVYIPSANGYQFKEDPMRIRTEA